MLKALEVATFCQSEPCDAEIEVTGYLDEELDVLIYKCPKCGHEQEHQDWSMV